MTITYRSSGAWGAGKGSNLTAAEVDGNFYDIDTRLVAVESNPAEPVQIDSITSSGSALTITMDDATVYGPFALPVAQFDFRGVWAPATAYLKNDVITESNQVYLVAAAHTSASTFDANRVISGNPVYGLMVDTVEAAEDAIGSAFAGGSHTNISFSYNDTSGAISAAVDTAALTEAAVDGVADALAAGSHTNISFSYNDTSGSISATVNTAALTEAAVDGVADALVGGTHTGISFSYSDTGNTISATVSNQGVDVKEGGSSVVAGATTLNFDASDFNITNVGGVATIASSAAVAGGVDVREGASTIVSGATVISFDAGKFNVTDVSGVATVTATTLIAETAKASTSGTTVEFTGLPSGIKRITVMFRGVSTSGSSPLVIQLGTSGGFVTSGYVGSAAVNGTTQANITAGLATSNHISGSDIRHGVAHVLNITGDDWVSSCMIGLSNGSSIGTGASSIALGGTLDRIRLSAVNGTDTFDAGTINIFYE